MLCNKIIIINRRYDDDDGKLVDQPNQSTIILIIHHHGNFELNWEIPKPALKIFIHDGGWMIQPSNHSNQTNERPWSKRPRSFVFVRSSIIIKKKMLKTDERTKKISKNNDYVIQPYANHNMYRWYIEHTLYISGCVIFSNLFFLDSNTVKK